MSFGGDDSLYIRPLAIWALLRPSKASLLIFESTYFLFALPGQHGASYYLCAEVLRRQCPGSSTAHSDHSRRFADRNHHTNCKSLHRHDGFGMILRQYPESLISSLQIRLGGTCKMWREASHSATHLTARTQSKCSFRDLAEFISRLPDLQRLDLSRCPSTLEIEFLTFLRFLALRCPSLRYLSVAFPILARCKSSGEQLGNDHWEKAKTANDQVLFSSLQHLNISNASNAVVELLMKQAPKVSVLIASGVQLADLPSDLTHVDLCKASTFSLAMFSQAHRHSKLPRLEKVLASKRLGLADMSVRSSFPVRFVLSR